MTVRYDKKTDTLTVLLGPANFTSYEFEKGDFAIALGENDNLISISITNAGRFDTQMLAAGVEVEDAPKVKPAKSEMVWHDADSTMISANGYNQSTGELDIAYHRTGVYRYYDVPLQVFEELRDASSKGRYIRSMIIDMYPYEKKRGR